MAENIGTARLDIVVDTSSLDAGVTKAKRSTSDMAKAAQDASQKMDAGTKRQVQALERQIATLGKSRSEVIRWRIEQQTSGKVAAELAAKLDAQTRKMSLLGSATDKMGASAKRAVAGWAGLLAASVSVGAAFSGIKNSIDFADKLNDINQRLGVSAEALSGWAYAAQQTGTDVDALGVGMKKLAKNMAEALDPKSSQFRIFDALGVSIKDTRGNLRSMEAVLPEIASRFKDIKNETLKAALAQEVFGKSGTDLIEFLNQGSSGLAGMRDRARELGIVLSQDTLTAADAFNDKVGDLKAATQGLFTQLSAELLPSITKLVDRITDLSKTGQESGSVIKWIGDQADAAVKDFDFFAQSISDFTDLFGALKNQASDTLEVMARLSKLDFSGAASSFGHAMTERDKAISLIVDGGQKNRVPDVKVPGLDLSLPWERQPFSAVPLFDATAGSSREAAINAALATSGGGAKGRSSHSKRPDFGKEAAAELERLAAEEDRATKAFERMEATLRGPLAVAMLEHKERVAELNENAAKSPVAAAGLAQALELEAKRYAQVSKEIEAQQNPLGLLIDDMKFELDMIGRGNAERAVMNELRRHGIDLMSKEAQGALATARAYEVEANAKQRSIGLMDDFRQGAENALVDFVTGAKSATDALKDFFDELGKQITRAIANQWIEKAFGPQGQQGSGAAGDWIQNILGAFAGSGGGTTTNGWFGFWKNGGAFANGVPVEYFARGDVFDRATAFNTGRGMGVMGEAGPEAIMPLSRGPDGKLGVRVDTRSQPPGPVNMTQNVVVQGRVTNATIYQLERAAAKGAARSMRRG